MNGNRTTIAQIGLPDFDITDYKDLLESGPFLRMRGVKQLGLAHFIFPDATHTRFPHLVGTASLAQRRAAHWYQRGQITADDVTNIVYCGLLHDIGHGPYSHASERIGEKSHQDHTLETIEDLRPLLERHAVNVDTVKAMIRKEHPLACAVTHRCLGVDKMHYLVYDSRHTKNIVPDRIDDLLNHVHFLDGRLAIDEKIIPEARRLVDGYCDMYSEVYLRKASVILQSFLRKIAQLAMENDPALTENALWNMDDSELDQALRTSSDKNVRWLFARIMKQRGWPRAAVILLPENVEPHDRTRHKSICVERLPFQLLSRFDCLDDRRLALQHERSIAEIIDIPDYAILLVPIADPYRFMPEDIAICDGVNILGSLEKWRPDYYANLRSRTKTHAAVRVCVFNEYREYASSQSVAAKVVEYLMETFCS